MSDVEQHFLDENVFLYIDTLNITFQCQLKYFRLIKLRFVVVVFLHDMTYIFIDTGRVH